MKPELHAAMLKSLNLEKLAADVPKDVIDAIQTRGFHKVAAALTGLSDVTDTTAAMYIGRKLAERLAERRSVSAGLVALAGLEKEAASFGTWMFGDPVGDHFRNKDQDLRTARQHVDAGEAVPKHLLANKYVAKHIAKDQRKADKKDAKAERKAERKAEK